MSKQILFNGVLFSQDEPLLELSNRGLCYGDGFFESMRIVNGKIPFARQHWQRIEKTCAFLRIQIPPSFTEKKFTQYAGRLASENKLPNARIRFQAYRKGQGRYTPKQSTLGWSMICEPVNSTQFELNEKGLCVDVCKQYQINPAPQSWYKVSNSLPYVLGGMFAVDNALDDCFLLDNQGFIAEATASNVFLLKSNHLVTPDLSNGGVFGVMRAVVMQIAPATGLTVSTALITHQDVLEADECFLTNATQGIRWVGAVGKKRFYKRGAQRLIDYINKTYQLS